MAAIQLILVRLLTKLTSFVRECARWDILIRIICSRLRLRQPTNTAQHSTEPIQHQIIAISNAILPETKAEHETVDYTPTRRGGERQGLVHSGWNRGGGG